MIYVFLEIDGVLRTKGSKPYTFDDDLKNTFEYSINSYLRIEDIRIIITSTWRLAMSLNEIKSHFSPEFRRYIVDVTPEIHSDPDEKNTRHQEILLYLKQHHLEKEFWVGIDNDASLYPKETRLLLLDENDGFKMTKTDKCEQLWKLFHLSPNFIKNKIVRYIETDDGFSVPVREDDTYGGQYVCVADIPDQFKADYVRKIDEMLFLAQCPLVAKESEGCIYTQDFDSVLSRLYRMKHHISKRRKK